MRSLITQSVVLPAPAEALYATYMSAAKHAAMTGAPVVISARSRSTFSAFGGELTGRTLTAIASRLIVQSWRSTHFKKDDPDSTLILSFVPLGPRGRIDLVHIDVPPHDYKGVTEGWNTHYWKPWRRYLRR
jgi:activator of HSP90 ATPase